MRYIGRSVGRRCESTDKNKINSTLCKFIDAGGLEFESLHSGGKWRTRVVDFATACLKELVISP
jgi:hypothetical protein